MHLFQKPITSLAYPHQKAFITQSVVFRGSAFQKHHTHASRGGWKRNWQQAEVQQKTRHGSSTTLEKMVFSSTAKSFKVRGINSSNTHKLLWPTQQLLFQKHDFWHKNYKNYVSFRWDCEFHLLISSPILHFWQRLPPSQLCWTINGLCKGNIQCKNKSLLTRTVKWKLLVSKNN